MWELASLVGKEGTLIIIYCYDYVVFFLLVFFSDSAVFFCSCCFRHERMFGGSHDLLLALHVSLLCFF